ncbi:MAG: HdeD family acid-resistance protein, partial [Gammaproteobacteria bacterium]
MIYMTDTLARNWWAMGLRGLCALLFGAAIFVWPGISLFALVLMFGVYTLLDGVCTMVSTVRSDKREKRWWLFLLQGIAGIIVGIMAFIWPGITALALLY